ncbi:MAG: CpaF family protein [Wujia sp.]
MENGLKERIKKRVMEELDMSREMSDEEVGEIIDRCILEEISDAYVSIKEKVRIRIELFNSLRKLDVLTEYLEDDGISEIMVNGHCNIFLEKQGKMIRAPRSFDSEEKLLSVIQQIAAGCNRRINEAEPIVDARLPDGSRVNIVMNPVSLSGPVVTIRRFPEKVLDMQRLVELGTLDEQVSAQLAVLIRAGYNIFISGGTGSGKTTLLNALAEYIPADERVITIEDSAELQIRGIDNLVRLEARSANVEGNNAVSIRDLIKTSLRMRPDRIIVGEVRDQAAIDMLSAMNTGHDGSISTGHANSCEDMLKRLETMVLMGMDIPLSAVKQQIASAIDIIIHVDRMRDRTRKIVTISEVNGMKDGDIALNTLFEFSEYGEQDGKLQGALVKVNDLLHVNKLLHAGLLEVYRDRERQLQCVHT